MLSLVAFECSGVVAAAAALFALLMILLPGEDSIEMLPFVVATICMSFASFGLFAYGVIHWWVVHPNAATINIHSGEGLITNPAFVVLDELMCFTLVYVACLCFIVFVGVRASQQQQTMNKRDPS